MKNETRTFHKTRKIRYDTFSNKKKHTNNYISFEGIKKRVNEDNEYLASQVNNFYSILSSLRSERY